MNTRTIIVLAALLAPSSESQEWPAKVGFYHWSGQRPGGMFGGIADIVALNATIARVAISARTAIDYGRAGSCSPAFTLYDALDDPDIRSALNHPGLHVVIITAYDGAGFADCATHRYLNPAFYSADNQARMVNEYAEFTYRLHQLFRGTGRKAILANWEGDNAIYCGSAYLYAIDEAFKKTCHESYPRPYAGNRGPDDSFEGMLLWFRARHLGVALGNARAAADGLLGPPVLIAVEISAADMLKSRGHRSVLYDVIPYAPFDYVSYSCYESLSHPDPAKALVADLNKIRDVTGSSRLIVGEVGFSRAMSGAKVTALLQSVVSAAIGWGAEYIIHWNLHDQSPTEDFGLYDLNGRITEIGVFYNGVFKRERACSGTANYFLSPSCAVVRAR